MLKDFSEAYERATCSVIKNDLDAARKALRAVQNWTPDPEAIREDRFIPKSRQVAVFRRDHFVCGYCGRRAVFVPTLRLLSLIFPDVLPYHPHGLMTECHLAFWRDIASCDHMVPVARSGSSQPDNLITACYLCNSIKQNWLLKELGWKTLDAIPPNATDWDGLSGIYPALLKHAKEAEYPDASKPYFTAWLSALAES